MASLIARTLEPKLNLAEGYCSNPFHDHLGPILRGRYKDAKKGDLAATCSSLCTGRGIVEAEIREKATAWSPEAMRCAAIEKAARTPLRSSFVDDESGTDLDQDLDQHLSEAA